MYLTDLAFIEEGTPDYTEDGLVNFSKMRMVRFPGRTGGVEHTRPAAWSWLLRGQSRVPERQRGRQHRAGPQPA